MRLKALKVKTLQVLLSFIVMVTMNVLLRQTI
ncbi:hypothetical protein [Shigella phage ESh20]|nr:hypothetical protein [Shigella phage ESh20]